MIHSLAALLVISTAAAQAAPDAAEAASDAAEAASDVAEAVVDNLPGSATAGDLRVLQLWSTDRERFIDQWSQPTPPRLTTNSEVQRNKPIYQFIIFSGCQANMAGNCNLSGKVTMTDPAGEAYGDPLIFPAWDNLPQPEGSLLSLSSASIGLTVEDGERLGIYRIKLSFTDEVAKVTATSEVGILVEEAETVLADGTDRIRILGFECGDNCYLEFLRLTPVNGADPASEPETALCQIDACYPWFDFQEMPPEFIGRSAIATIGIGEQYDNEGNVMSDDFPKILSITLDPVE